MPCLRWFSRFLRWSHSYRICIYTSYYKRSRPSTPRGDNPRSLVSAFSISIRLLGMSLMRVRWPSPLDLSQSRTCGSRRGFAVCSISRKTGGQSSGGRKNLPRFADNYPLPAHNESRDQRSGVRGQGSGITDQSPPPPPPYCKKPGAGSWPQPPPSPLLLEARSWKLAEAPPSPLLPALPTPYKKREKRAVKLCGLEPIRNHQPTCKIAQRHRNCETVEHSPKLCGSCWT
jgi:hypothetical protein